MQILTFSSRMMLDGIKTIEETIWGMVVDIV